MRGDGLEPDIPIVDQIILLIFDLFAPSFDYSHLHILIINSIEILLHDLRPMLVYL